VYYLDKDFLEREVLACFIPLRCSPEAVNCEVRQQYQQLTKKTTLMAILLHFCLFMGKFKRLHRLEG
jgi:hypothetical protein